MKLDDIKKPIDAELEEFEKHFRNSMKSKVALLDKIMYYIVQRKGKQVRLCSSFLLHGFVAKPTTKPMWRLRWLSCCTLLARA